MHAGRRPEHFIRRDWSSDAGGTVSIAVNIRHATEIPRALGMTRTQCLDMLKVSLRACEGSRIHPRTDEEHDEIPPSSE